MVLLDPSCCVHGVEALVRAEKQITQGCLRLMDFLSEPFMSLLRRGLGSLALGLVDLDPISTKTKKLISFVNSTLVSWREVPSESGFSYFTLDAWSLQPFAFKGLA